MITGGGTGIGRAVTLALAARGWHVAVNYARSEAEAVETAAAARRLGGDAFAIRGDVADSATAGRLVATVVERFGRLDLLVNNAGVTRFIPFTDLGSVSDDVWDAILAVNVKGAFYCARAAAPAMRRTGGGSIGNVASVAGHTGGGSSIPYACSKAALIALTKALATALAPDIRVNAISPGFIDTRWHKNKPDQAFVEGTPLKRLGTPEDVAEAVIAIGTATSFVTGQTLVVDGGRLMH